jgi:quinol monooxygenase YgiN
MAERRSKRMGWWLLCATALIVGCDGDEEGTGTKSPSATAPPPGLYIAVVRGNLANADIAQAKALHDQIATGGEADAKAAGDIGHDALLGTTLLDSIENEFLGVDQWTDEKKMTAFYADPNFQAAFGKLFATPPTVEYFAHAPSWVSWGDLRAGDAYSPSWVHLALGTLADADVAKNQAAHDQVAAGGKEPSLGAGNVAHVVFLGLTDPRRFIGVDIWKNGDVIQSFYSNPDFRKGFAPLFVNVTEPVYQSTNWHGW